MITSTTADLTLIGIVDHVLDDNHLVLQSNATIDRAGIEWRNWGAP